MNEEERNYEIIDILGKLTSGNIGPIIRDWKEFTGGFDLGRGTIYNTAFQSHQISAVLALSGHPLINELKNGRLPNFREKLIEERVLEGMKILDLGCGPIPCFARLSRNLGADVFTASLDQATDFQYADSYIPTQEEIDLEGKRHLTIDFNDLDIFERLRDFTGGEFDFTTESHLDSAGFYDGKRIAIPLLKKGGLHFKVPFDYFVNE